MKVEFIEIAAMRTIFKRTCTLNAQREKERERVKFNRVKESYKCCSICLPLSRRNGDPKIVKVSRHHRCTLEKVP